MTKIFVFGSNLQGIHGSGSAKFAHEHRGAAWGKGIGRTGDSYAIPTVDFSWVPDEKAPGKKRPNRRVLALTEIAPHVKMFIQYAEKHPELIFEVVPIGCGLAGYTPEEIAPLFKDCPANVELPKEFVENAKTV